MSERDTSWWHEASAPRRVEGGIKARSRRGAIGEQWWSRRFVEVLESFGMSGRLARGRNYARRGQVLEFEFTQGKVSARVQGSRPAPYQVRIGVLPLTTAQWKRVTEALGAQALFRAKLLAGEMPHEIEEVFAECGTPLFPRSARDLDLSCSCPDWEVPCKHLAAVCYVLAEKFDEDPFGMLAWRGRGREELLGALRRQPPARAGAAPSPGGTADAAALASGNSAPWASGSAVPLAQCADRFWSPGISRARLRAVQAAPPPAPDLLLRSVEPPDVRVRGADLAALLTPAYQRLAAQQDLDGTDGNLPA
ncbi:MAG TPA: SWIM zinc finger family protein [Streptosporangiaceae bacterium]|nr:SWIM zinc finger family protein [Streptosporangiaceae bacterium]